MIIVDIFIGADIPQIFTEQEFLTNIIDRLNPKGKIIYNTMRSTMPKETLNKIEKVFYEQGLKIKVLEKVEGSNDLILAEK